MNEEETLAEIRAEIQESIDTQLSIYTTEINEALAIAHPLGYGVRVIWQGTAYTVTPDPTVAARTIIVERIAP